MLLSTTETIQARRLSRPRLVRGNTIRAGHVGKDILVGLRNLVGGESHRIHEVAGVNREQALDRMIEEAQTLGATTRLWEYGSRRPR